MRFGGLSGEQLKTAPQGYAKDHPQIDLLRYKQFLADHKLTDDLVVADDLVPHVLDVCLTLRPFPDLSGRSAGRVVASHRAIDAERSGSKLPSARP